MRLPRLCVTVDAHTIRRIYRYSGALCISLMCWCSSDLEPYCCCERGNSRNFPRDCTLETHSAHVTVTTHTRCCCIGERKEGKKTLSKCEGTWWLCCCRSWRLALFLMAIVPWTHSCHDQSICRKNSFLLRRLITCCLSFAQLTIFFFVHLSWLHNLEVLKIQ